ncbi:MAG: PQQ-like beta-propeller repeat protein [Planctomycetia bacterium]|nr:PQQ-like beta-propeller repeat protein [Planctomycetia bacterium]
MIHRLAVPFCCLLAVVLCLPAVAAEKRPLSKGTPGAEWPQWRGEHRDGISTDTGLLNQWPKDGPPLLWKASGLGKGFSSISIANGRIFTAGDRETGQHVIALNLADGKEIWSTRISDVWAPDGYAGPRCTPTIDGSRVYVVGPHGDLVCLESDSGTEVWHRNMKADFGGQMHSGWGYSESPLVDGDRLVCTPGGPEAGIVALNRKTGAEIWRCAVGNPGDRGGNGAAYSSIVVSNGGGVRQYVQLMGRGAVGVATKNGKFLWSYNRVANGTANVPTPVVHDDYVFVSSGYQTGAALLHLQAADGGVNADEVYFLDGKQFQNHHGGMIMLGDYIYAGHGHNAGAPTCLEWKTGKTVWRHNRGPGKGSAAVAYADGNLYFRFQDGVMALVGATPDEYQEKGHFQIPDVSQPSWSHPVIVGGKLYLREQDALLCYDVKK